MAVFSNTGEDQAHDRRHLNAASVFYVDNVPRNGTIPAEFFHLA